MTFVCVTPPSLSSGNDPGGPITAVFTPIMVSTRSDVEVKMLDEGTGTAIGRVVTPSTGVVIVGKDGNVNDTDARTAAPVSAGPGLSGMGIVRSSGAENEPHGDGSSGPVKIGISGKVVGELEVGKSSVVPDAGIPVTVLVSVEDR
jgi:hypothetical protein